MIEHDYAPTDAGEHVAGLPRGPLTEDWLADEAVRQGVPVKELSKTIAQYRRVDGQPLYPVRSARAGASAAAEAPSKSDETESTARH